MSTPRLRGPPQQQPVSQDQSVVIADRMVHVYTLIITQQYNEARRALAQQQNTTLLQFYLHHVEMLITASLNMESGHQAAAAESFILLTDFLNQLSSIKKWEQSTHTWTQTHRDQYANAVLNYYIQSPGLRFLCDLQSFVEELEINLGHKTIAFPCLYFLISSLDVSTLATYAALAPNVHNLLQASDASDASPHWFVVWCHAALHRGAHPVYAIPMLRYLLHDLRLPVDCQITYTQHHTAQASTSDVQNVTTTVHTFPLHHAVTSFGLGNADAFLYRVAEALILRGARPLQVDASQRTAAIYYREYRQAQSENKVVKLLSGEENVILHQAHPFNRFFSSILYSTRALIEHAIKYVLQTLPTQSSHASLRLINSTNSNERI